MWRAPVGEGANLTRNAFSEDSLKMLIGAHVSTAGGLENAVVNGVERECDAIQIFNQSPRMWRPTNHKPENIDAFNESFEASRIGSVVIHAVYLINTTSPDPEIAEKSLASLTQALRLGDAISADGVVLHAGSRKQDPLGEAVARSGQLVREALAESDSVPDPVREHGRNPRPARP